MRALHCIVAICLACALIPSAAQAAADTGTMCYSDAAHTSAYDDGGHRPNNTLRWLTPTNDTANYVHTQPVIVDGVVYFASAARRVLAVDAKTGVVKWLSAKMPSVEHPTEQSYHELSPAVVLGDYVIVCGDAVYGLNKETGILAWTNTDMPYEDDDHHPGIPTVVGGMVYVPDGGRLGSSVMAVGPGGSTSWIKGVSDWLYEDSLGRGSVGLWGINAVTVGNGVLLVSLPNRLYAVDPGTGGGTGRPLAHDNTFNNHSPTYAYGNIYMAHNDNKIACYNPATLSMTWETPLAAPVSSGWYMIQTTAGEGLIFCAGWSYEHNEIMAVDAVTGAMVWDTSIEVANVDSQEIIQSMSYAGGVLYATTDNGRLWALNAAGGTVRWVYVAGNDLTTAPAILDGSLYLGGRNGAWAALYAVGTPGGGALPASHLLLLMN